MADRKLASIQQVSEKYPLTRTNKEGVEEEASNIALFKCAGMSWRFIAEKALDVGDLVVFFEIDSVLPEKPWSLFTQKNKFRIQTMKMWGTISQGLAIPIEKVFNEEEIAQLVPDQDVTALLGVVQYEVPETFGGTGKSFNVRPAGNFPSYLIPKTDQLRLQSVFDKAIKELFDNAPINEDGSVSIVVTQKMDGSSFTAGIIKDTDEFVVCSRNIMLKPEIETYHEKRSAPLEDGTVTSEQVMTLQKNIYWKLAESLDLETKLRKYGLEGYFIQGEMCGPAIQQNRIGLKEVVLYVYHVYDTVNQRYLDHAEFVEFCAKLDLMTVPILNDDLHITPEVTIDFFLDLAEGYYPNGSINEGIVWYTPTVLKSILTHNGVISYKTISPTFNLKYNE